MFLCTLFHFYNSLVNCSLQFQVCGSDNIMYLLENVAMIAVRFISLCALNYSLFTSVTIALKVKSVVVTTL